MTQPIESLKELPIQVKRRLDDLTNGLKQVLGENLVAIIVHGSAVRGGYFVEKSDVDLIVVLKQDNREILESISPIFDLARFSARIEAMILTEQEIPRAADVFPLLYDDVREKHAILYGTDPFANLHIAEAHRRLRIEQELREARIRLRRLVTDNTRNLNFLIGAIDRKLKQIRSPLRALLRMRGEQVNDTVESVLQSACNTYGLDHTPLLHPKEDPDKAYATLTQLLASAIDDVDSRE